MADYTYEQLHEKTVMELREIAKGIEHEAVKGYTAMHKEQLLPALCTAMGIKIHPHHVHAASEQGKLKAEIRRLKAQRDQALAAKDGKKLAEIRRKIHDVKRATRKG
jgi:hypothetical protein